MITRARTLAVLTGLTFTLSVAAPPAVAADKAKCKQARAQLTAAKKAKDRQAARVAQRNVAKYCGP